MIFNPTRGNIIVQIKKEEELKTTKSGIIIPSSTANAIKSDTGIVVAVGKNRILNNGQELESQIKVGDNILFNKFAGTEIKDDENRYLIIKENDILAIIE